MQTKLARWPRPIWTTFVGEGTEYEANSCCVGWDGSDRLDGCVTFQTRTLPSALYEPKTFSEIQTSPWTTSWWPEKSWRTEPAATSHTFTRWSSPKETYKCLIWGEIVINYGVTLPAEANNFPQGLKATDNTVPRWPTKIRTVLPSVTDHILIELSAEPVAT